MNTPSHLPFSGPGLSRTLGESARAAARRKLERGLGWLAIQREAMASFVASPAVQRWRGLGVDRLSPRLRRAMAWLSARRAAAQTSVALVADSVADTPADAVPLADLFKARYGKKVESVVARAYRYRTPRKLKSLIVITAVMTGIALYGAIVFSLGDSLIRPNHQVIGLDKAQAMVVPNAPDKLHMGTVSTAIPSLDAALNAFLSGDAAGAVSHVVVQQVACGTMPVDGNPPLPCAGGENFGTMHQMALSGCKPAWVSPDTVQTDFTKLLSETPGLASLTVNDGGYTAVLTWPNSPQRTLTLNMSLRGVESYGVDCTAGTAGAAAPAAGQ